MYDYLATETFNSGDGGVQLRRPQVFRGVAVCRNVKCFGQFIEGLHRTLFQFCFQHKKTTGEGMHRAVYAGHEGHNSRSG